jgi:hypothetical protein
LVLVSEKNLKNVFPTEYSEHSDSAGISRQSSSKPSSLRNQEALWKKMISMKPGGNFKRKFVVG